MRVLNTLAMLSITLTALAGEKLTEYPTALGTCGGSRLQGLLHLPSPLSLRRADGASIELDLSRIKRIAFGERVDPNTENQALVALNDLGSEQFDARERALATLRQLGRAALRPLRLAARSHDADVALRARNLLDELNATNADDTAGNDTVLLSDGTHCSGELNASEFVLRTRWGLFSFPVKCVEYLEPLTPADVNRDVLVPAETPALKISASCSGAAVANAAGRWRPDDPEGPQDLSGLRQLNMSQRPVQKGQSTQMDALKAGDRLEHAYALRGVLLSASAEGHKVQCSATEVAGRSKSLSAQVTGAELDISFVVRGTFSSKEASGRNGGVLAVGAFVKSHGAGSVGLAAYDRAGRQLARVLNVDDSNLAAGGVVRDEFLGIHSSVPIVRARFFRNDPAKHAELTIDDLAFTKVLSSDREQTLSYVTLALGERLAGKLESATGEMLRLRPEFLPETAPAVLISLQELHCYEPGGAVGEPGVSPRAQGQAQGILLQNGDSFPGWILSLDDKEVGFKLPGGAELKLPRETLRKIDLAPSSGEPGEVFPTIALAPQERPGVEFKAKAGEGADSKPDPNSPAKGLSRMDDVQILRIDVAAGELTIEDKMGPWDIGLPMVKALVFPPSESTLKAGPRFRDWILVLEQGSRFEVMLKSITPEEVTVEMAGGAVRLPARSVWELHRRKR